MSEEFGNDIITLEDEAGVEKQFEIIDALELDDKTYVAMVPYLGDPENLAESDGELVILEAIEDENGEEILVGIEDEDVFDRVMEEFEKRLEDEYEIES